LSKDTHGHIDDVANQKACRFSLDSQTAEGNTGYTSACHTGKKFALPFCTQAKEKGDKKHGGTQGRLQKETEEGREIRFQVGGDKTCCGRFGNGNRVI